MLSRPAHPQLRSALLASLADLEPGDVVIVACSGGPDSLALAAATAQVARERALHAVAIVIDHGLQTRSAEIAAQAAQTCRVLGLADAEVIPVQVGQRGGPEAAAREARYAALQEVAQQRGAAAVLLAHTMEDQAETVLLRLARGSGARSLAAMAPKQGIFRRPLLGIHRAVVHEACSQALQPLGIEPWRDPHNDDPRFARVRVRAALSQISGALGPDVVLGLARSAALLRDDADALEEQTRTWLELHNQDHRGLDAWAADLAFLPRALRTRIIRAGCLAAGSPATDLDLTHVTTVEQLITHWHGQGEIALPGRVRAWRDYGRLRIHGAQ